MQPQKTNKNVMLFNRWAPMPLVIVPRAPAWSLGTVVSLHRSQLHSKSDLDGLRLELKHKKSALTATKLACNYNYQNKHFGFSHGSLTVNFSHGSLTLTGYSGMHHFKQDHGKIANTA